ncbi:unnamed protein product [Diamesa serratosioi]
MSEMDEKILSDYDGSRIFSGLADFVGLSVDLTNFLITQGLALILASLFRSYLHPSKVSASVRHAFGLVVGLFFGYFCFGQQAVHIAGLPAVCYIIIRTQNPLIVQRMVMIAALLYLSCIHLHRQYNDFGSYTLDITGPLMIITQKVTSLAFSIHDGFVSGTKELTKAQQYHAVHKIPSPLEYFSYVLNFQGLMAGPMVFYRDYIEFIEGYNFLKKSNANGKLDVNSKAIVHEPSPVKAVVKKVLASVVCAYIFIKLISVYPIKNIKDDEFINTTNVFYQMWFIMMSTTAIRFKYYFAWLLADAICNNSGLGFNGYEVDGSPKWDLITNIYVIPFELGTSFRDCVNNWNIGTNLWLRMVVYERVPKNYGTVLTFALSALWHGFYPGYYMTFASGALIVMAARKSRRLFRHHFQQTELSRTFYDILTCLTTRVFIGYITFPFVLLGFMVSVRLYLKLFMCLHLVALFAVFVLPKLLHGDKRSSISNISISTSTIQSTTTPANDTLKSKEMLMNDNVVKTSTNDDDGNSSSSSSNFSSCSSSMSSSSCNSMNDITKNCDKKLKQTDTNYLLKDLIGNKIKEESDNLSNLITQKIELRNIEELFDKTVNGIVELKDDLMRMNGPEGYNGQAITPDGLRKRGIVNGADVDGIDVHETHNGGGGGGGVDAFLKKEIDAINAAVHQASVIPAVLSNGHAK